MKYLSVKNFERFQHYRDRRPPWIKLYVELFDDYEFTSLPDATRYHLLGIWVLASKTDNKIPEDARYIQSAIRATGRVDLAALVCAGWLVEWEGGAAVGKLAGWSSRYVSTEVRDRLVAAANGKCVSCGSSENLEIDHILPISMGGAGAVANLQVLCRSCNRRKRTGVSVASAEHSATTDSLSAQSERSPETEREREREKRKRREERKTETAELPPDVTVVLNHYCTRHPKRRPGAKDAALIGKALGGGYSVADLTDAIDGNAGDEWHASKGKHELSYVLRDAGHIDSARAMLDARQRGTVSSAKPSAADQMAASMQRIFNGGAP